MKRSGPPKRKTALRTIGRRAKREADARAQMRREVIAEAGERCALARHVPDVRCWGPLVVHELIDRSVRPGVHLDSSMGVPSCWRHNEWVNEQPADAERAGVKFRAHQVDEARARAAVLRAER